MKLNRGALILCGVYTGYFSLLMCLWYFTDDIKGAYLLAQFSVLPAVALLSWSGMIAFVPVDSWLSWLFFPISLAIAYFIGWGISAAIRPKDPLAPIDDPPDRHKS